MNLIRIFVGVFYIKKYTLHEYYKRTKINAYG